MAALSLSLVLTTMLTLEDMARTGFLSILDSREPHFTDLGPNFTSCPVYPLGKTLGKI